MIVIFDRLIRKDARTLFRHGKFRWSVGLIAILASVALVASACGGRAAETGQEQKSIKIGYINWDEDIALTNLFKSELEKKGYSVEIQQLDAGPTYAGLSKGDVDLFLDGWLPSTHEDYWNQYKDELEDLGVWYDGATLNLAVPQYVEDVNSIEDLKAKAGDFGGTITGIEASAGETRIVQDQAIPQYQLGMTLQSSSTTAMLAALENATHEQKPIVVTLWHPHWAYSRYPLKDLADPKGAMGQGEQLHMIGRKDFAKDFPEISEVAKNFRLDDQQLNALEDSVQKSAKGQETSAAGKWADQNRQFVDQLFGPVKS